MTDPSDPNPLTKRPLWRPDPTQPTHPGRAIDAPSLPPWVGRTPEPAEPRSAAVSTPATPAPTPTPTPTPPPAPEAEPAAKPAAEPAAEPALAQQAKAPVPQREPQDLHAVTQEDDSMTAEDPRELARRLAEEAKKRLQSVPPPTPDPPTEPSRSVEERAAAVPTRTMTAMEALAAAREAERQRAAAPAPPPPPPAQTRSAPTPNWGGGGATATEPAQQARTVAPVAQFAAIVLEAFPGAKIEPATVIGAHDVFRALWRAHRARAVHEGDVGLVATACVLLDAVDRVPQGGIAAGRVTLGPNAWAVWVDLERRSVLGVARPAEVYLVG